MNERSSPGSVTIPREPTREMWAAMADAVVGKTAVHHDVVVEAVYRAILASVPTPDVAATPLCPICLREGYTDQEACDHTRMERASPNVGLGWVRQKFPEAFDEHIMKPIRKIDLGYISRHDGETGESSEPDDEALIFLNDDNEQTCHVEGPNAKAMAAQVVAAVRANDWETPFCARCGSAYACDAPYDAPARLDRLRELVADPEVQNWPEQVDGGFLKLLEMRNLLTEIVPHITSVAQRPADRVHDMFAGIHPSHGIWNPSIRTSEEGARNTFSDWNGHAIAGWQILPVRVTYSMTSTVLGGDK